MGYPLNLFPEAIDPNIICGVCSAVMESAVLTPCGHSFCLICLQTWLSRPAIQTCPECRTKISENDCHPIHSLRNLIGAIQIKCPNEKDGCTLMIAVENLQRHEDECLFTKIKCVKCEKSFNRVDIVSHTSDCFKVIISTMKDLISDTKTSIPKLGYNSIICLPKSRSPSLRKQFTRRLRLRNHSCEPRRSSSKKNVSNSSYFPDESSVYNRRTTNSMNQSQNFDHNGNILESSVNVDLGGTSSEDACHTNTVESRIHCQNDCSLDKCTAANISNQQDNSENIPQKTTATGKISQHNKSRNNFSKLSNRLTSLEIELHLLRKDLDVTEVKNKRIEKELEDTKRRLTKNISSQTEVKSINYNDELYNENPYNSLMKLANLLARFLLDKPSYISASKVYDCIQNEFEKYHRNKQYHMTKIIERKRENSNSNMIIDDEDELLMLIATANASNWFTRKQKKNMEIWMTIITQFSNTQGRNCDSQLKV